jgi:hypothetical protein
VNTRLACLSLSLSFPSLACLEQRHCFDHHPLSFFFSLLLVPVCAIYTNLKSASPFEYPRSFHHTLVQVLDFSLTCFVVSFICDKPPYATRTGDRNLCKPFHPEYRFEQVLDHDARPSGRGIQEEVAAHLT